MDKKKNQNMIYFRFVRDKRKIENKLLNLSVKCSNFIFLYYAWKACNLYFMAILTLFTERFLV